VPKLKTLSGRQVRSILESHGFAFVSQNGSHMKMRFTDADSNTVTTVIVPDHKELKIGTLSGIIQQSGIGRGPFEA
jgi:predicted RNA binding protein YcfA (HicA-like mRNA interferase family)